jgi:hypothetical protein
MAAVMAPYDVVMQTLSEIDGYVVAANINSYNQCVVGGASKAVEQAIERFRKKGFRAMRIPVSHAFHTKIVAPASKPLRKVLDRLSISRAEAAAGGQRHRRALPDHRPGIKDILELQIASPVQWVKGLETMYREGRAAPLSRSAPRRRSRALWTTCWAASPTWSPSSPITPRPASCPASTRRCAGCTRPATAREGSSRSRLRGQVNGAARLRPRRSGVPNLLQPVAPAPRPLLLGPVS